MCGCRSGIRAGTATTSTSRSAGMCRGALIERAWPHGHFWIKLVGNLPAGAGRGR